MGIEPTQPAWKAGILPLNYTRISAIILSGFISIALLFLVVKSFFYFFTIQKGEPEVQNTRLSAVQKTFELLFVLHLAQEATYKFLVKVPSSSASKRFYRFLKLHSRLTRVFPAEIVRQKAERHYTEYSLLSFPLSS